MGSDFDQKLQAMFNPISLNQMNATASFLDRIDTKYVVTEQQFIDIIWHLKKDFYVLEIGGKSIFEYDSVYMDTEDYAFYQAHQNWNTSRTKIRTREYVDSGLAFFEYKQKEGKLLRKFRYQMDIDKHGIMTPEAQKFYEGIFTSFYKDEVAPKIYPSLTTHCNRLTLCSKDSSERVTIDFNVRTTNLRGENTTHQFDNAVIIESKATSSDCKSHKIMKKYGIEKVNGCSKYCLGLITNGIFDEAGKFKDTLEKLEWMS